VFFVLVDGLAEALCSGVDVGEERGIVSVGRVKVSGELASVKKFKLGRTDVMETWRTRARAAAISSTAIFRAAQSTSGARSACSPEDGSDMGGRGREREKVVVCGRV